MNKLKRFADELVEKNSIDAIDQFFKARGKTIPQRNLEAQDVYRYIGDNLIEAYKQAGKPRKTSTSDLKDAIRARLLGVSSNNPDSIKATEFSKRQKSYKEVSDYLEKKEQSPRTRIFNRDELEKIYKPAHQRYGNKHYSRDVLKEYNKRHSMDSIFDSIEKYRESDAFKNFSRDDLPKLTEKQKEETIESLLQWYKAKYGKNMPLTLPPRSKITTSDFENAKRKSIKKLYPNENPDDVIMTPKQIQTLKDFFRQRGRAVYKDPKAIDHPLIDLAITRAMLKKYAEKPAKRYTNDYDGFTVKDVYPELNFNAMYDD